VQGGFRRFPPRLPEQPIFYPVLTREYARRIARDWNTADPASGYAGFVTEFEVEDSLLLRYPPQVVGGEEYRELWIPADELDEFHRALRGPIRVIEAFTGPAFSGRLNPETLLPE